MCLDLKEFLLLGNSITQLLLLMLVNHSVIAYAHITMDHTIVIILIAS